MTDSQVTWNWNLINLFLQKMFYTEEISFFFRFHQGDGYPTGFGPGRASNPVNIILGVTGNIEIHHQVNSNNIYTS